MRGGGKLPRRLLVAALVVLAILTVPRTVMSVLAEERSTCRGTVANGSLESGVPLRSPAWMDNVRPYCHLCERWLRTYVHSDVAATVYRAYEALGYDGYLQTDWVYAEAGWPWGGSFKPHRTHQNGLSVDFMVPLKDGARFPTHAANRYGYDEAFDAAGRGSAGRIDFKALADHLDALDHAAREQGGGIAKVILAPNLQDDLFAARPDLRDRLRFNRNPVWVRHDDHYHVDFDFPCAPS